MASRQVLVQEKEHNAWDSFNDLIFKNNLDLIPNMPVVADSTNFKLALDGVRAEKIVKIVYDKSENNLSKFNSLFSALNCSSSAVFILLRNCAKNTEIYLGINSEQSNMASTAHMTLTGALQGNFPGIVTKDVDADALLDLSEALRSGRSISCVTGVPSKKELEGMSFSQGLEKLIEAMGDESYTAFLLATPVGRDVLADAENAYRNIFSQLSMLNINQISMTSQESQALGKTISESFSRALSTSVSNTNTNTKSKSLTKTKALSDANSKTISRGSTTTEGENWSKTITDSTGENQSRTRNLTGVATTIGAVVGTLALPVIGTMIGGAIGGGVASLLGSRTKGTNSSHSEGTTEGGSHSFSETENEALGNVKTATNSNALTEGDSEAVAMTKGTGETETTQESSQTSSTDTLLKGISYNYAVVEKNIVEAEKIIEEQLERIRQCKNYGAWNWAAYFLADTSNITNAGANIFSGILRGQQSGVERSAIIHWDDTKANFKNIQDSLAKIQHPLFEMPDGGFFSPTSLLSTPELTVGMSLPQKSLPGLPVFNSAEFGRSVIHLGHKENSNRQFHLGNVVHLDKEYESNEVLLDLDSLTSHAFITGSTGSGKSNAIYNLLNNLRKKRIPFLVIEPAKGEYKEIFGGLSSCRVLGTNPYQSELLRINPFSFPAGIHIMEHIDRLIEILNAAWPMYAAMPAILKAAVEKAYVNCGWNLLTSRNSYGNTIFPDFSDLLAVLPETIECSKYSAEVESNYKGALVTRVNSMTNGYFRSIFQKDEISSSELFDKNTIVDLSRVSSMENKALLMGVLFQKLQEYRISTATEANRGLQHVTVLEEAHHLLRRTSIAQGDESANLTGKSIEMLTNAIAEMRTYGEGFIIADQAPELLDPAVIRNTNTKIAFNLPNFIDRDLVGKAQGLDDEQVEELAHLRCGYASVFQNNWQEAVICKAFLFDPSDMTNMGQPPKYDFTAPEPEALELDSRTKADSLVIETILRRLQDDNAVIAKNNLDTLRMHMPAMTDKLQSGNTNELINYLNNFLIKDKIEKTAFSLDINTWTSLLMKSILTDPKVADIEDELKNELVKTTFLILQLYENNPTQKAEWQKAGEQYNNWRLWK